MEEPVHADPLLESMLGKNYRVLERIGMGGMAVVYLVEHLTLHKRFAAKVLSAEHASSAEARARFTQEAHAASQLDHENIVGISDFGITNDQRPYFVMELLRGQTLAERLDDGPMSVEEVVAVAVPAARALAYSHAEGVIHRDVKPENIFLVQRSQGRWGVKVLDFGIAKVPVNDRMTKTGQALGSPMFMAPEACRGDEVDQRADVYSFGVVLYMMTTGRVPFSDENLLKVLQMQVTSPVPPPTTINPKIPPALEAVIMMALAKDRDERYANMEELLVALEESLPEGADVLLIQAQFGASITPFPGSLERVRNSARMAATASGKFQISTTGQHSVHSTGRHNTPPPAASLPAAPTRRGRALPLAIATVALLGAAGAGGYFYMNGRDDAKSVASTTGSGDTVAVAPPTPPPTKPAIIPTPAPPPPPTPPPLDVETGSAAVAAATSDAGVDVDAGTEPDTSSKVVADKRTKDPKKTGRKTVATATAKPTAGTTVATKPTTTTTTTTTPTTTTPAVVVEPPPKPEIVVAPKPVDLPKPDPKPTPPPPPAPTPVAPPKAIGSLDATPVIAKLDVDGSLPSSTVRRAIDRVLPTLRTCYRAAAKAKQATPPVSLAVRFVIDEHASAQRIAASGDAFGPLGGCVQSALARVTTQQAPDVGTVNVRVTFKFTPL